MTSTMSRWVLAGALALGALGAAPVFDVGSTTAEAAPSVSPFAGTFRYAGWPATVTISNRGRIKSSYSGAERNKGSIKGRVRTNGSYSFTRKRTLLVARDREGTEFSWRTYRIKNGGTMASDADGNLVLSDTRGSLSWLRQ